MPGCNLLHQASPRNGVVRRTTLGRTPSPAPVASRAPGSYGQPGLGGYGAPPQRDLAIRNPVTVTAPWGGQGAQPIGPTSQQTISWITFAAVGLLGLLGTVLTLTLWINMSSAVSRATDMCNRFGGEYSSLCRQQIKNTVPSVPAALVTCLFLIIAAGLAATAGAVMLFLKKRMGHFLHPRRRHRDAGAVDRPAKLATAPPVDSPMTWSRDLSSPRPVASC